MEMLLRLLFLYLVLKEFPVSGNLVPDYQWTFDVDENRNTYEVNSVTENVGWIMEGTTIVSSNERYGSVAHFNGVTSGIIIDNMKSTCFLNPALCTRGLSFSFWINWEKWGSDPMISSPSISMKHMVETTMLVELWNGQNSWSTFISRNPPQNGIWFNYLFSWNKTSLDIFLNGALLQRKTTPSSNRHSLLTPFASNHSTRLSIGRSSSTGSNSKVKMQFDDLKIWEKPLNETEALQVYQLGIYNPSLFKVEDITPELQFSYMLQEQFTETPSAVIADQQVESLMACFKSCSSISTCTVVGFKNNGLLNACQIRNGISFDEKREKGNEQYHYYSVDRD